MRKLNAVVVCLLAAAAVMPATLAAAGANRKSEDPQTEALFLMKNIARSADTVSSRANVLEMISRSPIKYSPQTYWSTLAYLKGEVNAMVPGLTRLSKIEKDLPEWDQQLVNQTIASEAKLASITNQVIEKEQGMNAVSRQGADYRKLVNELNDDADALLKSARAAIAREKALGKMHGSGMTAGEHD